jgi:hypothetical protein
MHPRLAEGAFKLDVTAAYATYDLLFTGLNGGMKVA